MNLSTDASMISSGTTELYEARVHRLNVSPRFTDSNDARLDDFAFDIEHLEKRIDNLNHALDGHTPTVLPTFTSVHTMIATLVFSFPSSRCPAPSTHRRCSAHSNGFHTNRIHQHRSDATTVRRSSHPCPCHPSPRRNSSGNLNTNQCLITFAPSPINCSSAINTVRYDRKETNSTTLAPVLEIGRAHV